ncbi:uncharacterized protein C8Q71DRAFT_768707 [Rhodofomes roseus]|uniref:Uncharacterized protein n=1 Tax=Rhodofomes roseus TaxID=34475 RepID=A0ABQ8KAA0_9APHY|nr:uncharacterized protein C8Q71DRAFT_768707 [Rhodofomes roseus]KAH9834426.1 hypothetical protein C8Q71DRAFT_768707 [Rhodofomes roseus]
MAGETVDDEYSGHERRYACHLICRMRVGESNPSPPYRCYSTPTERRARFGDAHISFGGATPKTDSNGMGEPLVDGRSAAYCPFFTGSIAGVRGRVGPACAHHLPAICIPPLMGSLPDRPENCRHAVPGKHFDVTKWPVHEERTRYDVFAGIVQGALSSTTAMKQPFLPRHRHEWPFQRSLRVFVLQGRRGCRTRGYARGEGQGAGEREGSATRSCSSTSHT